MSAAQQALYAYHRLSLGGSGHEETPIWAGPSAASRSSCGRRRPRYVLVASLLGVIVQDVGLFGLTDAASSAGPLAMVLQGLVLLVAVALVGLGRRANATAGWPDDDAVHDHRALQEWRRASRLSPLS